jgi:hypothetical protein
LTFGAFLVAAMVLFLWPRCVLRAKVSSQESSAVSRLRTIADTQTAYRVTHEGSYADSLALLGVRAEEQGYTYSLQVVTRDAIGRVIAYIVRASPGVRGKTGVRYFSVDDKGNFRYEMDRPVDDRSPSL